VLDGQGRPLARLLLLRLLLLLLLGLLRDPWGLRLQRLALRWRRRLDKRRVRVSRWPLHHDLPYELGASHAADIHARDLAPLHRILPYNLSACACIGRTSSPLLVCVDGGGWCCALALSSSAQGFTHASSSSASSPCVSLSVSDKHEDSIRPQITAC
jgi:hypothetical protein